MRLIQTTTLFAVLAATATAQEKLDKPVQKSEPTAETMVKKDRHYLHKIGDSLGADVRAFETSDELGEVKDLIINRDGWVDYAVIEFDKGLKTGDKLFAVPWGVLQPTAGDDPDDCVLVLDVPSERLKAAPSFDEDKWPDLALADWSRPVDDFYREDVRDREAALAGSASADRPVARPAGMNLGSSVRASDLKGCNVSTSTGEKAGEIEEVALDGKNGRVALVVLATGGFLGMGEDRHALPWQALSFSTKTEGDKQKKELVCRLNIPESKLENAPKYDKADWNKVAEPVYVEKVYTHFGYPAYWKHDGRKAEDFTPSDKPKEDKQDKEDEDKDG